MKNEIKSRNNHVVTKYRLQSVARSILPDSRTSYCMRRQVNGATNVHKDMETKRTWYSGLMTCGSRWTCPVCDAKKSAQTLAEMKSLRASVEHDAYLVTYTIQHRKSDKLATLLSDLNTCIAYMRNGAKRKRFDSAFGSIGFIRSVEIRWNEKTGFHPHIHELLLVKKTGIDQSADIVSRIMGDGGYGGKLRELGYHTNEFTIDCRAEWSVQEDHEIEDYLLKSSVECEISFSEYKSGYSVSMFQLLDLYAATGDLQYHDVFQEYGQTTAGKQKIRWSAGLKNLIQTPVELDEKEPSRAELLLATLDQTTWFVISELGLRGTLLKMASELPRLSFYKWLNQAIYGGEEKPGENHATRLNKFSQVKRPLTAVGDSQPPYMEKIKSKTNHHKPSKQFL